MHVRLMMIFFLLDAYFQKQETKATINDFSFFWIILLTCI